MFEDFNPSPLLPLAIGILFFAGVALVLIVSGAARQSHRFNNRNRFARDARQINN